VTRGSGQLSASSRRSALCLTCVELGHRDKVRIEVHLWRSQQGATCQSVLLFRGARCTGGVTRGSSDNAYLYLLHLARGLGQHAPLLLALLRNRLRTVAARRRRLSALLLHKVREVSR